MTKSLTISGLFCGFWLAVSTYAGGGILGSTNSLDHIDYSMSLWSLSDPFAFQTTSNLLSRVSSLENSNGIINASVAAVSNSAAAASAKAASASNTAVSASSVASNAVAVASNAVSTASGAFSAASAAMSQSLSVSAKADAATNSASAARVASSNALATASNAVGIALSVAEPTRLYEPGAGLAASRPVYGYVAMPSSNSASVYTVSTNAHPRWVAYSVPVYTNVAEDPSLWLEVGRVDVTNTPSFMDAEFLPPPTVSEYAVVSYGAVTNRVTFEINVYSSAGCGFTLFHSAPDTPGYWPTFTTEDTQTTNSLAYSRAISLTPNSSIAACTGLVSLAALPPRSTNALALATEAYVASHAIAFTNAYVTAALQTNGWWRLYLVTNGIWSVME